MTPLDAVLDFVCNKLDHATPNELEMFFRSLAEVLPAPARQEAAKAAYHFHYGVRAQTKFIELLAEQFEKPDPPKPAKPHQN